MHWGSIPASGFGDGSTDNTDAKAFVNIIMFDKNYNFLDFAYAQVTSSGSPTKISASYTAKEAGYAFVYISNEHPTFTDVYFDDVKMTYIPSRLVQYNEYYPFGLQTKESWTRDNNTNNFLGNGGSELNTSSGWYETFYRGYDATLGRFHQVDPMAASYHDQTPYQFAGNNPVVMNDPMGDKYYMDPDWSPGSVDYIHTGGGGDPMAAFFSDIAQAQAFADGAGTALTLGDYSTYTDAQLVEQARAGNAYALDEYGDRYGSYSTKNGTATVVVTDYVNGEGERNNDTDVIITLGDPKSEQKAGGGNGASQERELTPDQVNNLFSGQFRSAYWNVTPDGHPGGKDAKDTERSLKENMQKILKSPDGGYLELPGNPFKTLRPVRYEIGYDGTLNSTDIVDPGGINSHPLWGNPGTLNTEGVPKPFKFEADDGSTVNLIIYFQQFFP